MLREPQNAEEIISMKADPNKMDSNSYDPVTSAGCTANVCLKHKNKLYIANAGDARSVICVKNKTDNTVTEKALSIDHKPDDPLEKNRITNAGGFV